MFRLIKLAAYAAIGYLLYELYQGITAEQERSRPQAEAGGQQHASGRDANGRFARQNVSEASPPQAQPLTGPAHEGAPVSTHGSDGGSLTHQVGRGVVSRK